MYCILQVTAFVPNDGCLNFVVSNQLGVFFAPSSPPAYLLPLLQDENDEVLIAGFGRKGKAKGCVAKFEAAWRRLVPPSAPSKR